VPEGQEMKKIMIIMVLFSALLLSGCAAMLDILDILAYQPPVPVCDKDSVGSTFKGQQCLKYSDGNYRWTEVRAK